jgi:prolyl-tRNA editing enzyme YbaK/EbsC (Cys-tRNA(Pro) deacylase)
MSKSLKRVRTALELEDITFEIRETGEARTAKMAADELGVHVDQIVKSIVFRGENSGDAVLFLTAGGQQVDTNIAAELMGEPIGKADAALVRAQTGFAIGGVSPVGHLNPIRTWFDRRLLDFHEIWAAAGTPHHVFNSSPDDLLKISSATAAEFTVKK